MRALSILAIVVTTAVLAISIGAVATDGAVDNAPASEETVITSDTVIAAGEVTIVDGSLVVAEGATLTVDDGGKLRITETGSMTVDGTLICGTGVKDDETLHFGGESLVINGKAVFEGNDSLATVDDRAVVINGEAEITGEIWNTYNIEVTEGGTAVIGNSRFSAVCHGTIVVDTGDETGLSEVRLGTGGTVVVESLARVMMILVDGIASEHGGDVGVSAMGASGFTVESVPGVDGTSGFRLSGGIIPTVEEGRGGLLAYGHNDLTIGDLSLIGKAYMNVLDALDVMIEGDMTAPAGSIEGGTLDDEVCSSAITVAGSLTMAGALGDAGLAINAAEYIDGEGNHVYVPLEDVVESGADEIVLHGENSIGDPSVLAGITVTVAEGATLSFGEVPRTASENAYLVVIAILALAVIVLACAVARR